MDWMTLPHNTPEQAGQQKIKGMVDVIKAKNEKEGRREGGR